MKLIIAGSRNITDYQVVRYAVARALSTWGHPDIEQVVSGGAKGIDSLGEHWADAHGISKVVFPADWQSHGKRAGPIRNQEMADYCDPDTDGLVAIPGKDSIGTWDMVRRARVRGLKVYVAELTA